MSSRASKAQIFLLLVSAVLPAGALAHITVDPKEAPAGGYAKLVFRVPHGCDGSPTTQITIRIPQGVLSVKPQVHPGWEISIKKQKLTKTSTESISEVSWSGGPLPDEYMDEFGMSVKLPKQEGSRLSFPVIQECKKGSLHWTSIAPSKHEEGAAQLPAPAVLLTRPSKSMGHH